MKIIVIFLLLPLTSSRSLLYSNYQREAREDKGFRTEQDTTGRLHQLFLKLLHQNSKVDRVMHKSKPLPKGLGPFSNRFVGKREAKGTNSFLQNNLLI